MPKKIKADAKIDVDMDVACKQCGEKGAIKRLGLCLGCVSKQRLKEKPKQLEIPGTEGPVIEEIDDAADAFTGAKEARTKAKEKEDEAKLKLAELMHKHGLVVYRYEDKIVEIVPKEAVKVRDAEVIEADDLGDE